MGLVLRAGGTPALLLNPGIDQAQATIFEVGCVARSEGRAMREGNGRDLGIEVGDGPAPGTAMCRNLRKNSRSLFVERQYSPGEFLAKYTFRLGQHLLVSLASGKQLDAEKYLGDRDGSNKYSASPLDSGQPLQCRGRRCGPHRFRNHVGVQNRDHTIT